MTSSSACWEQDTVEEGGCLDRGPSAKEHEIPLRRQQKQKGAMKEAPSEDRSTIAAHARCERLHSLQAYPFLGVISALQRTVVPSMSSGNKSNAACNIPAVVG